MFCQCGNGEITVLTVIFSEKGLNFGGGYGIIESGRLQEFRHF